MQLLSQNKNTIFSGAAQNYIGLIFRRVALGVLAILIIKQNCLNLLEIISTASTNTMSTTEANSVYTDLSNAQTAFTSAGISSIVNTGSNILASLISQINSSSGASNSAKVINFIISKE